MSAQPAAADRGTEIVVRADRSIPGHAGSCIDHDASHPGTGFSDH